jgi:isopentenyldiphosphate isomerase
MKKALFSGFLALVPRTILRTPAMRSSTKTTAHGPVSRGVCRYSSTLSTEAQTVQDMLFRVREINRMPDDIRGSLLNFEVDGVFLGKIRPAVADLLCSVDVESPVFELQEGASAKYLTLSSSAGDSFEERTSAVARVTERLRDQGVVHGWRDELYPITGSFYDAPSFLMERAAVPLLGAIEYGVHINGVVRDDETGETKMWMARRSATKSKYPGMVDHIAAGGQPAGMSLMDNVVKECMEEAGIPEALTRAGIQAVGAISYETFQSSKDTVTRAVMFNFDLHLPQDFQPAPVDGEVQEFFLWSIDEVLQSIAKDNKDPIKPNCYAAIIDYLLRNGHVSPDTPGYLDVLRELRSGDCR